MKAHLRNVLTQSTDHFLLERLILRLDHLPRRSNADPEMRVDEKSGLENAVRRGVGVAVEGGNG